MSRKLILTPYEHGFFAGANDAINKLSIDEPNILIDTAHIFLSAVTMAGVDSIQSIGELKNSNTKLAKRITNKGPLEKWLECSLKVSAIFDNYKHECLSEEAKLELSDVKYTILGLLYAMKTNSGILLFSDLNKRKKELLPLEVLVPTEVLFSSMEIKKANLPILKYDINKKDIQKVVDVLDSKVYHQYSEAQSEIEQNSSLSIKTVKSIEKAGKDLYKKNLDLFYLKDNVLKAVPMTAKVIDLFFGKLPGLLAEYGTGILIDYLKLNKAIPVYNCDEIWNDIIKARLVEKIKAMNNGLQP